MAFRRTLARFGGDRKFHYPYHVQSPAGGWWNSNPNAGRNTTVALAGLLCAVVPLFYVSSRLEYRPNAPTHWIPSSLWCKKMPGDPGERLECRYSGTDRKNEYAPPPASD
jgi:hypothetical protein